MFWRPLVTLGQAGQKQFKCEDGVREVAVLSVLVGTFTVALSLLSIIYQLNGLTIGLSALLAVACSIVSSRNYSPSNPRFIALWIAIACPFLVIPAIMTIAPPYAWDEVAYSAALPKLYAALGHVVYLDDYGPYSAFPAYYEVITTAALAVFHSVTPVRILGVILFLATAMIAGVFARLLIESSLVSERSAPAALVATALVLSASVGTYSTYVKGDIANAYFQIVSILAFTLYLRQPKPHWMMLAGLALGLSVGTKYNSLQFAVSFAVLAVPFALARQWPDKRAAGYHLAWFFAVAAVVSAPWYLRNFIAHGNPFYPFLVSIFNDGSAVTPQRIAMLNEVFYGISGFSYSSSTLMVLLKTVVTEFGRVPIILAPIGAAGVLYAAWNNPRQHLPCLFLVAIALLYSAVVVRFGLWAPRYFLVLLGLYAAFAAVTIQWAAGQLVRITGLTWAVTAAAAAVLGLLMYTAVVRQRSEQSWLVATVLKDTGQKTFVTQTVNYLKVAQWINANLGATDRIGIGIDVQPFYYIERRYYNIHPLQDIFLSATTASDFLDRFRQLGLTHIAIQEWIGQPNYPEATNPMLYRFIHGLESAVTELQSSGKLVATGEVEGLQGKKVRFFKLANLP